MKTSHIATALEQLEAERAHVAAVLQKIDTAIGTLRELFHLPAPPRSPRSSTNGHGPNGNGHGSLSPDVIRAALKAGPLTPGALAEQLDVPRVQLRHRIRQLEAEGLVVSTGATGSRRIALVGPAPAKEAPQRR